MILVVLVAECRIKRAFRTPAVRTVITFSRRNLKEFKLPVRVIAIRVELVNHPNHLVFGKHWNRLVGLVGFIFSVVLVVLDQITGLLQKAASTDIVHGALEM